MFDSANIGTIIAVLALLVTGGTLFGTSLRVSRNTQTVADYREAAMASEAKATAQKGQIEELQASDAAKAEQIIELTAKVQLLQDMVTGKTAIEQLSAQVAEVFARIEAKIVGRDAFEAAFRDLRTEIGRQR